MSNSASANGEARDARELDGNATEGGAREPEAVRTEPSSTPSTEAVATMRASSHEGSVPSAGDEGATKSATPLDKSEGPASGSAPTSSKETSSPFREGRASPFPTRSPLDGSALDPIAATPLDEIESSIARARAAQQVWGAMPVRDRAAAIAKLKRAILSRAETIAELVGRECGRPSVEAVIAEVLPVADIVDYWAIAIEELLDPTPVELDPLTYPGKLGRIVKEPRGVVALITPFTHPVAIPLRALVPALLAGNAVVWKPSEIAPRSAALIASLFQGIVPEGLVEVVQGGADVGAALVAAEVDAVVFTGSAEAGRKVAVACAERLVPCSLQLGGKDAAIVLADATLDRAARGVVWGAFANAGQGCAAIERVYVEKKIADRFIERVVALTNELRPGADTAVMATKRQCDTVRRQLESAVADGAEVLAGGMPETDSLEFRPTVVKLSDESTSLMREETLGPILPIVVVDDANDAVERANASRYALTTSIWTRRLNFAHELASRLRSGIVTINNHGSTMALPSAPWAGVGDSGHGVANSPYALGELTRPRFILEDRRRAKSELFWYPYTPTLRTVALALARVRGGAGFFGRIRAFFQLLTAIPKRRMGK